MFDIGSTYIHIQVPFQTLEELYNYQFVLDKYYNRTKNISEEVTFDEETNSIKSDNVDEYLEFTHDLDHQNKIKKN